MVIDLIRQIIEHPANEVLLQLTIPLDDTSAPETLMVPLAGVLLEYPLAYVPGSRAGSHSEGYLSGVPLDVYECLIQNSTTGGGFESTLLKFSCPHTLGQKYPELATGTVHERLYTRFNQRLRSANLGNLSVNHSIVALDRVAL